MKSKRPESRGSEDRRSDYLSYMLDRPSRSEIVDEAIRRLHGDLAEVRKLTHNA